VQTGGVDAETGENLNFLSGVLFAGADRPETGKNHDFLSRALFAVDAETRKNHDYLSEALFIRCKQAAWTQRPEKTITFYPGLYVFAGADRRRGRRDRKT
jgi:hypothetical protein